MLGSYDPRADRVELKADRIKHWISMGATVSDTVHNLLISQKIIEGKKINVLPRKSPPKKEGEEAPVAAPQQRRGRTQTRSKSAPEPVSNDVAAETPSTVRLIKALAF
jgi:small subunit ribosomal protein S16